MFEYINHLRFGHRDPRALSWEQWSQLPASPWVFPAELETYFQMVFAANRDIIAGRRILDIGCEHGTKIPWFAKMQPSELVCIDPAREHFHIAEHVGRMVGRLSKITTICALSRAEDFTLAADTLFLLSVNHYLEDQFEIYRRLRCDHLVLDTWTDRTPALAQITDHLAEKYTLENEAYYKKNRVVLRYRRTA